MTNPLVVQPVSDISEQDGHWLAGLTDGEGCFGFYVRAKPRPNCYSFDFTFKIALRKDDLPVLHEVERVLGIKGNFYTDEFRAGVPNAKPLSAYRVYAKENIARLIQFFDRFPLRSKKARDYAVWREAFLYYQAVVVAEPMKVVAYGTIFREAKKKARPSIGTPKAKLRRTPDEIVSVMKEFAARLAEGRTYRD